MQDSENKTKDKDKEIIELAKKRQQLAFDATAQIREKAKEDIEFTIGDQWPYAIKNERDRDRRPCLVVNRLPQFVRNVTNDQRQNRPAIKVSPVDDQADKDTAKVLQGLIRHIEYNSDADVAYDNALDQAARSSFGYFELSTDYKDQRSFEQEIKINMIENQFSVFFDPESKEYDGKDARWAGKIVDVYTDDFFAEYPDSKLKKDRTEWDFHSSKDPDWVNDETIRLCVYHYKDYVNDTLLQLSNGEVVLKSEVADVDQLARIGREVVKERPTKICKIRSVVMNSAEILKKTEFPGIYIPIIPVYGDKINNDGKRVLESVVRHALDPQRMVNYWASAEAETITLAPKAPWVGAEGQFEGKEHIWATANVKNHAFLEYKPTTHEGHLAPPPQRNVVEPPVMAITNARMQSNQDLKETTGIYDAAMGNVSNETSGIGIQRRAVQSQTSNFHFADNLARSIKQCGRIIINAIPIVYDTKRAIRILGEDNTEEVVRIMEPTQRKGQEKTIDFSVGQYDVRVSTGPNYQTKRQESAEKMIQLAQASPAFADVSADLIAKNLDFVGAEEISERIQKTMPAELLENKEGVEIPPQIAAQMKQQDQVIQQMTEQLNTLSEQIQTKRIELDSKEKIEAMKIERDYDLAEFQANQAQSMEALKNDLGILKDLFLGQRQAGPQPVQPGPMAQQSVGVRPNE